jgi:hypothetical protein
LSGIRTHDPSNQPAKTHASDRTATVTGNGGEDVGDILLGCNAFRRISYCPATIRTEIIILVLAYLFVEILLSLGC